MKSLFEAVHTAALPALKNSADSAPKPRREPGPRRQQIEAEHQAEISRAYLYASQCARSTEELEALDRAYQARMSEGPDFTRYRSKSRFGEAPPHRLDREGIAKLRFLFNSMARRAWKAKEPGKHRGIITRTCKDVFGAFLYMAGKYPALFPSFERLAHLAQCSARSVGTALALLESLGFITRHRRIRMVQGLLGRKAEQTSNGYEVHPPRTAWGKLTLAVFSAKSDGNYRQATDTECYHYLRQHPETWGGRALTGAYGGPP